MNRRSGKDELSLRDGAHSPATDQSLIIKQEFAINGVRPSKGRELFVAVYERQIANALIETNYYREDEFSEVIRAFRGAVSEFCNSL